MKTRIISFVCIIVALMLLAACGSGNNSGSNGSGNNSGSNENSGKQEDVEISFLYQMDDRWTNEFWDNLVDQFEAENPGITVNQMSYPSTDKKQEYSKTLFATGQMPDVTFAGLEDLKLLDDVFLDLPETLYSILDDTATSKRDGKVYTMPTSRYIMLDVFYNKDIFEKYTLTPPNTWDEFIQINETLKENGVTPFVEAGQGVSGFMLHNPMMTVMMNEVDPNYPQKLVSGELKFNGPEVTAIAERFQSLWDEGYYHEGSLSFTGAQKDEKFMEGSAAMAIHGIFNSKKYAEGSDFNVGWFSLPGVESAEMYPVMYGEDLGVSADTEHPEEALKLVEYMFSDEAYLQLIEYGNAGYTTKKEFTYEQDYLTKEMYEITAEKTPKITFMKIEDFPSGTAEAMRTAAQDIAHGGDIEKVLDKLESVFRDLLQSQK